MLQGVLNQLLGAHIDHIIIMIENGFKLCIHPFLNQRRRILPINTVHIPVYEVFQIFCRVFNFGREKALREQLDFFNLIRNGSGIGDYNLLRRFRTKILKLFQHLVCGTEINRAAAVRIRKLLCRLKNSAILFILRVQKVHVTGCHNRFAEFPSNTQNRAVIVLKHFRGSHAAFIDQKSIIADRLNLKVIVSRGNTAQFLILFAAHHSAIQLTHSAGRSQQQPLPVFLQKTSWNHRSTVKVFQIRI